MSPRPMFPRPTFPCPVRNPVGSIRIDFGLSNPISRPIFRARAQYFMADISRPIFRGRYFAPDFSRTSTGYFAASISPGISRPDISRPMLRGRYFAPAPNVLRPIFRGRHSAADISRHISRPMFRARARYFAADISRTFNIRGRYFAADISRPIFRSRARYFAAGFPRPIFPQPTFSQHMAPRWTIPGSRPAPVAAALARILIHCRVPWKCSSWADSARATRAPAAGFFRGRYEPCAFEAFVPALDVPAADPGMPCLLVMEP
jgi:hypothetical protein